MAKRMTETTKWTDGWFADLSPVHKLAWLYLLDMADAAGGVDLSRRVANLTIGAEIDWDEFLEASAGRVEVLTDGKLFLPGFVEFQYGELKEDYNPHKPALKLLPRYLAKRNPRLAEALPKACQSLMDKDQDQDKDKDQAQDKKKPVAKNPIPDESLLEPVPPGPLREATARWLRYKSERKERYQPTGLRAMLSRIVNLANEHGESAVVAAMDRAMANGWKGFDQNVGATSTARAGPTGKPQPKWETTAEIMARGAL